MTLMSLKSLRSQTPHSHRRTPSHNKKDDTLVWGVVYLKSLINGAFARLAKYSDAEHKKADTEVSAFYLKNRFGVRNFKAREDF